MDPFNRNMKTLSVLLVVLVVVCATLAKKWETPALCKREEKGRRTDRGENSHAPQIAAQVVNCAGSILSLNTSHPVVLSCSCVWQDRQVQRGKSGTAGWNQGTGERNWGAEEWTKRYPRPGLWTQWPRSHRCQVYLLMFMHRFFFLRHQVRLGRARNKL